MSRGARNRWLNRIFCVIGIVLIVKLDHWNWVNRFIFPNVILRSNGDGRDVIITKFNSVFVYEIFQSSSASRGFFCVKLKSKYFNFTSCDEFRSTSSSIARLHFERELFSQSAHNFHYFINFFLSFSFRFSK